MEAEATRLFVGKLSHKSQANDVEEAFSKYGRVCRVDLKQGYAFVFMADNQSARDAIEGLNNREINGNFITVEMARSVAIRDNSSGNRGRPELRLSCANLEQGTSWQDLKDWARDAGKINFANVFTRDSRKYGVIEYESVDDVAHALRILPDRPLRGVYVRLTKEHESGDSVAIQSRESIREHPRGYREERIHGAQDDRSRRVEAPREIRGRPDYDYRDSYSGRSATDYRGTPGYTGSHSGGESFDRSYRDQRRDYDPRGVVPNSSYSSVEHRDAGYDYHRRSGGYSEDYRKGGSYSSLPIAGGTSGYHRGDRDLRARSRSRSRERHLYTRDVAPGTDYIHRGSASYSYLRDNRSSSAYETGDYGRGVTVGNGRGVVGSGGRDHGSRTATAGASLAYSSYDTRGGYDRR